MEIVFESNPYAEWTPRAQSLATRAAELVKEAFPVEEDTTLVLRLDNMVNSTVGCCIDLHLDAGQWTWVGRGKNQRRAVQRAIRRMSAELRSGSLKSNQSSRVMQKKTEKLLQHLRQVGYRTANQACQVLDVSPLALDVRDIVSDVLSEYITRFHSEMDFELVREALQHHVAVAVRQRVHAIANERHLRLSVEQPCPDYLSWETFKREEDGLPKWYRSPQLLESMLPA